MPSMERGITSKKGIDVKNIRGRDFKEKREVRERIIFFPIGNRERR